MRCLNLNSTFSGASMSAIGLKGIARMGSNVSKYQMVPSACHRPRIEDLTLSSERNLSNNIIKLTFNIVEEDKFIL